MIEDELEKKAKLYADEHYDDTDEYGFWFSDVEMLRRAYIAGAKEMQEENNQLKQQIEKLQEGKQYETCPYRSTDMGCDYCDYRDRDLKDEVVE